MGNACRSEDREEDVFCNSYEAACLEAARLEQQAGRQERNTRFSRYQQQKRAAGRRESRGAKEHRRVRREDSEPIASDKAVQQAAAVRQQEMEEYRLREEQSTRHLYDLLQKQQGSTTPTQKCTPAEEPADAKPAELEATVGTKNGSPQPDLFSNPDVDSSSSISLEEVQLHADNCDATPYRSAAESVAETPCSAVATAVADTPATHVHIAAPADEEGAPHECFICLEDFDPAKAAFLPCLHSFHSCCVRDWLLTQMRNDQALTCPTCFTALDCAVLHHVQSLAAGAS